MSTTIVIRYLFLYAALWAHCGTIAAQQQGSGGCTLCADGSTPTAGASLGGTDCGLINDSIGMTPADSADCLDIQLQGYAYCGCPTIPDSYCTMCDYDESGFVALPSQFENLIVPGTTDLRCGDAEFMPRKGGTLSCAAVRDAAYYCGCVGAETPPTTPTCFLCGADHANAAVNTRLLPPLFTETCAARDREIGTLTECTNNEDDYVQLINVTSYCGCITDAAEPIGQCPLCGAGNDLVNANAFIFGGAIKCRQLETVASYVIDADYCSTLQSEANETCCMMTMPPSAAPSRQRNAEPTAPTTLGNEPVMPSNDTASSSDETSPSPTASPRSTGLSPSSSAPSRCTTTVMVALLVPLLVLVVWG
jgi:hypothetical protein